MIMCFSGTGNSKFIAERLSEKLSDPLFDINKAIKNNDHSKIETGKGLVIVTPTYAWRIPRIVYDWIENTEFTGSNKTWFIMTCGSEIGNAGEYNERLCREKNFSYMGTLELRMPENYIAMFNVPSDDECRKIIARSKGVTDSAARLIENGDRFIKQSNNIIGYIMSSVVNKAFYPFAVSSTSFMVKDTCIGCKKCEDVCPLNNIALTDGIPKWGKTCTHCMACITSCPVGAIEYGNKTKGKPRYRLENVNK